MLLQRLLSHPRLLHFGGGFVSDYFVGDPVEDVENEEGQGKRRSGDGVDPLRPVHKLPLIVLDRGLLHGTVTFHRHAVLHACRYAVAREMKTPLSELLLLDSKNKTT